MKIPEHIVAIDPGKNPGFALFKWGELEDFGRDPKAWGDLIIAACVCERPYGSFGTSTSHNLFTLCIRAGQLSYSVGATYDYFVLAQTWKRSIPKSIKCERIRTTLNSEQNIRLVNIPASYQHDVLDAIGLGQWFVKKAKAGLDMGQFQI